MRRLTATLYLIYTTLFGATAQAETLFLCESELATGFAKINGTWETRNFKKDRWTIRFSTDYKKLYGINPSKPFECVVPFSFNPNEIVCMSGYGLGETFTFGKVNFRFLYASPVPAGYVRGGIDTSNLYAGTCKTF